jgi:two-component system phosphate regulon response regulator PhoB
MVGSLLAEKTILLVEDEPDIRMLLEFSLQKQQAHVFTAATGEEGLSYLRTSLPDLILLDWMLPGLDGLAFCTHVRRQQDLQNIPIIMLTAKGEEDDIVQGLEVGATDYVTKPYSTKVLMARIQAALVNQDRIEKKYTYSPKGRDLRENILELDSLKIYTERCEVLLGADVLKLTPSEYRVLLLLMTKPDRVYTRNQIKESLAEKRGVEGIEVSPRSIDVLIVGLRKKLKSIGNRIVTVRGVGYRFVRGT